MTVEEENARLRRAMQRFTGQEDLTPWLTDDEWVGEPVEPTKTGIGFKIAPDLSPQQQAYIETPEVQAKLKSGEYAPIQKGSDEWNHGH